MPSRLGRIGAATLALPRGRRVGAKFAITTERTRTRYAEEVGVSVNTVGRWIREGILKRIREGILKPEVSQSVNGKVPVHVFSHKDVSFGRALCSPPVPLGSCRSS